MARSNQAEKSIRLIAAYRLIACQMSLAVAAETLVREKGISLRHAYRYLEQAAQLDRPLDVAEPAQPISFKIPGNVIRALRTYAAANELTLRAVVTRAIEELVARRQRDG